MAKETPPVVQLMDLSPENLAVAEKAIKEIIRHEGRRREINADMDAERKKVVALGVSPDALRASLARYKMDPEQRETFDMSRQFLDKALGIPIQGSLFDEAEEAEEKLTSGKPKAGSSLPAGLESATTH